MGLHIQVEATCDKCLKTKKIVNFCDNTQAARGALKLLQWNVDGQVICPACQYENEHGRTCCPDKRGWDFVGFPDGIVAIKKCTHCNQLESDLEAVVRAVDAGYKIDYCSGHIILKEN